MVTGYSYVTGTVFDELLGSGGYAGMEMFSALVAKAQAKLYPDGSQSQYPFVDNLYMMIKQSTAQKRYANPVYVGPEVPCSNPAVMKKASRVARLANAAYFVPSPSDICVGLAPLTPAHVHLVHAEAGVGLPNFFIAHDPELDDIVLAIRGTATVADALTDTWASTSPFMGGLAHEGMLTTAQAVCQVARAKLVELMESTEKKLVITGHSLGAGTAVLVMLLLCGEEGSSGPFIAGKTVKCWAFAAPPVFGPPARIPAWTTTSVFAFVHHVDMIPRLGLASAFSLLEAVKVVDSMDISALERASYSLESGTELRVRLPDHGTYAATADAFSEFEKLTSIGTNFLMFYNPGGQVVCDQVQPDQLDQRILLHDDMVNCHLLGGYIKIIDDYVAMGLKAPTFARAAYHRLRYGPCHMCYE